MGCLPRTTERPMREQGAVPQSHGPVCQSTGRRKSVVRGLLNTERGFSLTELLAALAISGVVMGAATGSFISQSRSYDAQGAVNEMHHRTRVAMDMMTREIRMAGYNPNGGSFDAIQLNPAYRRLEIRADLDGDTNATGPNEHISYDHQDSGQIIRTIRRRDGAGTWDTFVDNIEVFLFQFTTGSANAYQFTDKDGIVLTGDFTEDISASEINVKEVSTVPGATAPAGCTPDCYAYDPNGASDPASVPPGNLGYVGGLDSSVYGSGTLLENLVSISSGGSSVKITIRARTAKRDPNYPLNDGFRTYTLTSMISPRNL